MRYIYLGSFNVFQTARLLRSFLCTRRSCSYTSLLKPDTDRGTVPDIYIYIVYTTPDGPVATPACLNQIQTGVQYQTYIYVYILNTAPDGPIATPDANRGTALDKYINIVPDGPDMYNAYALYILHV